MAVRKIIRMGHPTLRQIARPLTAAEIGSDVVGRLVQDMIDTLHDYGGIGLAAPQVNESIRLAIVELPGGTSRYGELPHIPLTVFINPEIEVLDPASAGYWEGCLSVPGLRGFVERPQEIRVTAVNLHNKPMAMTFSGFPATVFQHEFDHLDGKLYIDRLSDPGRLVFEEEFERYVLPLETPDIERPPD
jgi:peptide deformylase